MQWEKLLLPCCGARTWFAWRPPSYRSLCEIFLPFSNGSSTQNPQEMQLSLGLQVLLCEKERGISALEQRGERESGSGSTKWELAL